MSSKVIDRKIGWDQVMKALDGIESIKSYVGVRSDAGYYTDEYGAKTPVVKAAAINEFGGRSVVDGKEITVPERSFLRGTLKQNNIKYRIFLKNSAKAWASVIEKPGSVALLAQAVERLGNDTVHDIVVRIAIHDFDANAPITIRKKKGDTPLYATGRLRRNIKSKTIIE